MANDIDVQLTGWAPVIKKIRALPVKMQNTIIKKALGKAAFVIRKQVKQNALAIDDPDTGRRIADNVAQRVRSKITKRTGNPTVSVGIMTNPGRIDPPSNPDQGKGGNTPEWYLVELGTSHSPANPFVAPALAQSESAATAAFQREVSIGLDKAVRES